MPRTTVDQPAQRGVFLKTMPSNKGTMKGSETMDASFMLRSNNFNP